MWLLSEKNEDSKNGHARSFSSPLLRQQSRNPASYIVYRGRFSDVVIRTKLKPQYPVVLLIPF
jgi:hypothetical protein